MGEAIRWLTSALEHEDGRDGEVVAALARMYGVRGLHDRMISLIRQLRAMKPEKLASLREPEHLIMLVHPCISREDYLQQLGTLLNCRLPTPIDAVRSSIYAVDFTSDRNPYHYVDWYVIGRSTGWHPRDMARFPVLVRIQVIEDAPGTRQVRPLLPVPIMEASPDIFDNAKPPQPIDGVIKELDRLCLVVCQAKPPWTV